jgi:hypothetical protein
MSKRKLTALNKRYCEPDLSKHICSICHEEYVGCGNNAQPVNDGRCCGACNGDVIDERLRRIYGKDPLTGRYLLAAH